MVALLSPVFLQFLARERGLKIDWTGYSSKFSTGTGWNMMFSEGHVSVFSDLLFVSEDSALSDWR